MDNRRDFILDFETIGQNVLECPAIDVAYTTFDWDRFLTNPYTFEELINSIQKDKFSMVDQTENYGCKFKSADLHFWSYQSKDVRQNIVPSKDDLNVHAFFDKFIAYLREAGKIQYWWSRSNTFDPIILQRLSTQCKRDHLINEYLKFWRIRDIRTFIDAKFDWTTKNGFVPVSDEAYWNKTFKEHDSRHDVAADVLRLQSIYRAENDMEISVR